MEALPVDVEAQVAFLRAWVERHRHEGGEQWYVDEHVVDVDADVLWNVLRHGLLLWHSRVPGATAPGTDVGAVAPDPGDT